VRVPGLFRVWAAGLLALAVLAAAGCARVERHVVVWRADDPGGVYPSGPLNGDPAYFVGWRVAR
jgi:hypothetical protein